MENLPGNSMDVSVEVSANSNFVAYYFFWLTFLDCKFSPKTYIYILFDSEWEYDSGESDLELNSHPLCGHPKGKFDFCFSTSDCILILNTRKYLGVVLLSNIL